MVEEQKGQGGWCVGNMWENVQEEDGKKAGAREKPYKALQTMLRSLDFLPSGMGNLWRVLSKKMIGF